MSSSEAPTRPTRGRVARAVEETARRRRRDPNDNGVVKRLAVPEDKLDRTQFAYRWVLDAPGRIDMLTAQDWDLVSDDELTGSFTATRHADVAQNRLPQTTRLMRKPIDFYEEDHALRLKRLEDEMKAAELGKKVLNGPQSDVGLEAEDPRTYQPHAAQANKL